MLSCLGSTKTPSTSTSTSTNDLVMVEEEDKKYWEIGATLHKPMARPLTEELREAMERNTHPAGESQEELGMGVFTTRDWRRAWNTYQSPPEDPQLIDSDTGYAKYVIDDIDGEIPDDLVGVLYRNGPGRFGWNGDRVQHVLDADGLILQITFPPPDLCNTNDNTDDGKRQVMFQSRFVVTKEMVEEQKADKFLYRGTFGTAPTSDILSDNPRRGLNEDPWEAPWWSKMLANAMKVNIKNSANTQIISFGGKVLALFEAGLPHLIDPDTLETLGEDDLDGTLPQGLPVKMSSNDDANNDMPVPDFLGGSAHTAHPNICPDTGNLVGWSWSQLVDQAALEVTFVEWNATDFTKIASSTHAIQGCQLAPHDMALTTDAILLKVNSLSMNTGLFLSGMKGPAASLAMDGRAPAYVHVFPRPTMDATTKQFEPFVVEVPACFSIHFSHAYHDDKTGNIISMFSGWPPSDSKDFLGAWGGFAPVFSQIPPTFLWRMEICTKTKTCVDLTVAPGSHNVCIEHPLVHPNFNTKKAMNVYCTASNVIGDSTAPCGYCKLLVEDGSSTKLKQGEKNTDVDVFWFGSRCFVGEPLIVPKINGNLDDETDAYLLGMVKDSVKDRTGVAIFDLKDRDLKDGPIAMLW
eukprot:CAMPEP_0197827286 /NCGR_PEP_ID=MMETSP1437-20131217/4098_1 /TAXON_ID=49252 ORGANISM="Eucampia antarctica, Strain CCMP1452" /NCGR_SAMPLE_ID=MMETSP1437 /ASSEMBLY_ACC=CAM_ASM_001096 /LENGTH=634 /DNA_ID=CAMNT_0043428073 /DNA_START=171 /DNA_END=2072 /DNA_ORIENTATION=+